MLVTRWSCLRRIRPNRCENQRKTVPRQEKNSKKSGGTKFCALGAYPRNQRPGKEMKRNLTMQLRGVTWEKRGSNELQANGFAKYLTQMVTH